MKNHTIAKMMLGWVMFFSLPTSSFGWKASSINEKPFVIYDNLKYILIHLNIYYLNYINDFEFLFY